MTDNMKVWNAVKQPPLSALRQIQGGRLRGKTDINPQWRYQAITEQFGMCGIGWKYEVVRVWNEPLPDGQVLAHAEIKFYFREEDKWSDPIPGIGGSMLVEKESSGLHANDEGYKMAITDALSVAMKMIGVGADIYAGLWDGAKYKDQVPQQKQEQKQTSSPEPPSDPAKTKKPVEELRTSAQVKKIFDKGEKMGYTKDNLLALMVTKCNVSESKLLTKTQADELIESIEKGEGLQP